MSTGDFSLRALHAAIDAQRQARRLSWQAAMTEINRARNRPSLRPISASTVAGMRAKAVAEGDGVLQMLLWLNRTPESFVPDHALADADAARLPDVPSHQILRFDTRKLHAAIAAKRVAGHATWTDVASQIGVGVSSLTHLANGGRTAFPHVMRMTAWLGRPAAEFTRGSDW